MKISVAIAALNEGPQLVATVADLLAARNPPHEIIVVDDDSFYPVDLPKWPGVRVIYNDSRLGSGPAKHKAGCACTGDVVMFLDGHMRVPVDFFEIVEKECLAHKNAVLSPMSRGIESGSKHYGMGGNLVIGTGAFWEVKWAPERKEEKKSYPVPAVMGGCYILHRHVLDSVGGYCPGFLGYGFEEEYLSIRANLCGFHCRVIPQTRTYHYYCRPFSRKTKHDKGENLSWELPYNRRVAARVLFEPGVYERSYDHKMRLAFQSAILDEKISENCAEISAVRALIQKNRKVIDADLESLCGIVHPASQNGALVPLKPKSRPYDPAREEVPVNAKSTCRA